MTADMNTSAGKRIRMSRLIKERSGACMIFAIDHGMTSPVFLPGLGQTDVRIGEAVKGGANVIMAGRGVVSQCASRFGRDASLALMLTASAAKSSLGPVVTRIGDVDEALRLAADAVVVYVALEGPREEYMISYLSEVGESCAVHGMPLIAEAEFPDAYSGGDGSGGDWGVDYLMRNARLCAELGADIIKVNWSGDPGSFEKIVLACDRPVVVAGGPVVSVDELLIRMELARTAGAIGCSVGRNVFEHESPELLMRSLSRIFEEGYSGKDALVELTDGLAAARRAK
jgi:DhnA family fructose-bisphosphate aldolase class Ia